MASDKNFIDYVLDQLSGLENVKYKKMFGDFCIYYRDVPVLLACDNNAFIKIMPETTALLGADCATGFPYDGAKLNYVLDIDDRELAQSVVKAVAEVRIRTKK